MTGIQKHRGYVLRHCPETGRWNIENARGMPMGWALSLYGARAKVDRLYETSQPLASAVLEAGPL